MFNVSQKKQVSWISMKIAVFAGQTVVYEADLTIQQVTTVDQDKCQVLQPTRILKQSDWCARSGK